MMVRLPAVLLGAVASVSSCGACIDTTGGGSQRSHFGRETPEVTPVEEFYIVSKNLLDPGINADRWSLRLTGSVDKVVELNYDDIKAMPSIKQYATLQCISNDVGGDLMGNALWTGVPLKKVLDLAGPKSDVTHVLFRCEDDYMESLPIERATLDEVLLTYEMNGAPLTEKHGYPLRLLVPGKYGMQNPKWITEIILASEDKPGYWVERSWSSESRDAHLVAASTSRRPATCCRRAWCACTAWRSPASAASPASRSRPTAARPGPTRASSRRCRRTPGCCGSTTGRCRAAKCRSASSRAPRTATATCRRPRRRRPTRTARPATRACRCFSNLSKAKPAHPFATPSS